MILKRQDLTNDQGNYLHNDGSWPKQPFGNNQGNGQTSHYTPIATPVAANNLQSEIAASIAVSNAQPDAPIKTETKNESLRPSQYIHQTEPESGGRADAPSTPQPEVIMTQNPIPQANGSANGNGNITMTPNQNAPTPPHNIFSTAYHSNSNPAQPVPMPQAAASAQQGFAPNYAAQNSQQQMPAPRLETRPQSGTDGRRLVVGADISLNGEISTCDILVVEGSVQAALKDCKRIEIASGGVFKGNAEIETAIIAGLFEGNLTVRGTLHILPGGKINGSVRYGINQVDAGGEINGEAQSLHAAPRQMAPHPGNAQPVQNRQGQSKSGTYNNLYGTGGF